MQCPECDTTMHMDSKGMCACISCGYNYDQSTQISNQGTYSNKGLLQGVMPKFTPVDNLDSHDYVKMPEPSDTDTNDAGELKQSTEETLIQRGKRYGEYRNHAKLSQEMKSLFHKHVVAHGQPEAFEPFMVEAIDMIFHKLARIANGSPTYDDNFRDIAGYAELVVNELES